MILGASLDATSPGCQALSVAGCSDLRYSDPFERMPRANQWRPLGWDVNGSVTTAGSEVQDLPFLSLCIYLDAFVDRRAVLV